MSIYLFVSSLIYTYNEKMGFLEKLKEHKTVIFGVVVFVISGVMVARGFYNPESFKNKLFANIFSSGSESYGTPVEEIRLNGDGNIKSGGVLKTEGDDTNNNALIKKQPVLCDAKNISLPASFPLIINEVSWMGSAEDAKHEWIELKNISKLPVSLFGWQFFDKSQKTEVFFGSKTIQPNDFFILARNSDGNIESDATFSGTLNNSNEELSLFDSACNLVDYVSTNPSWSAGDNKTKATMERGQDLSWHTSVVSGGTPRKENSSPTNNKSAKGGQATNSLQHITDNSQQITNNIQRGTSTLISLTSSSTQNSGPNGLQQVSSEQIPNQDYKSLIFITEVMAGKDGAANWDFVELYNSGPGAVDLTGWSIKKKTANGGESTLISANTKDPSASFEGKVIPAGAYFLLANAEGYTGVPMADVKWPKSYTLAYTKNAVVLYNKNGNKIDEAAWEEIPKNQSISRGTYNSQFNISGTPTPKN